MGAAGPATKERSGRRPASAGRSAGRAVDDVVLRLARAFLADPRNDRLRDALADEALSADDFHRALVALCYRVLACLALGPRAGGVLERQDGLTAALADARAGRLWLLSPATIPELDQAALTAATWRAALGPIAERWTKGERSPAASAERFAEWSAGYPHILAGTLAVDKLTWECAARPAGRRGEVGSFYTPPAVIDVLLESALEPDARLWTKRGGRLEGMRLLDPACGCGLILWSAVRRLAGRGGDRAELAFRAAHGCDVDPLAVGLTQVLLGLESGTDPDAWDRLADQVAVGNALRPRGPTDPPAPGHPGRSVRLDLPFPFAEPTASCPGFDLVLGNPPFGEPADPAEREEWRSRYPHGATAGNLAGCFVERAAALARPGGGVGFVVPKSLVYSHRWTAVRRFLAPRLRRLVDVSQAFAGVRLEQAVLAYRAPGSKGRVRSGRLGSAGVQWGSTPPARAGDFPLCMVGPEAELWRQVLEHCPHRLHEFCVSRRGDADRQACEPSGTVPVLAGRDLTEWSRPSPTRFLSTGNRRATGMIFAPPRAVFQNIVAHVRRPTDHIRLIGTVMDRPFAGLDTVNVLDGGPALSAWALAGLLLSDLVNWLLYVSAYHRACRTMHFDRCFLARVPVPPAGSLDVLDGLGRRFASAPADGACWRELNRGVHQNYGVEGDLAGRMAGRQRSWK